MSLEIIVYLAGMVDGLKIFLSLIVPLLFSASFLSFIYPFTEEFNENDITSKKKFIKFGIKSLIFALLLSVTIILIPSKKTIYTILTVSSIKNLSNTLEAEKALKIINLGLDKAINNLQKNK